MLFIVNVQIQTSVVDLLLNSVMYSEVHSLTSYLWTQMCIHWQVIHGFSCVFIDKLFMDLLYAHVGRNGPINNNTNSPSSQREIQLTVPSESGSTTSMTQCHSGRTKHGLICEKSFVVHKYSWTVDWCSETLDHK